MASRRLYILEALAETLEQITLINGFNTDAGLKVELGQDLDLAEADPDAAIVIVPGAERFDPTQTKLYSEWPLAIRAVVKADLDQPWVTAEMIIADIERAVEVADRTFGDLVNFNGAHGLILDSIASFERAPGSSVVGMEALFIAKLQRSWGDPLSGAVQAT